MYLEGPMHGVGCWGWRVGNFMLFRSQPFRVIRINLTLCSTAALADTPTLLSFFSQPCHLTSQT